MSDFGEQYEDTGGFEGDGFDEQPQHDAFDQQARSDRIAALLEGHEDPGPQPDFEPQGEQFEPMDDYDQARADTAAFDEYERVAKAAEVEAFQQDVQRQAGKHGLAPMTEDQLKTMYVEMRDDPQNFNADGVERFMDRYALSVQQNAAEHEKRLLAIRHGNRDPETGEFPTYQEQQQAKDEWYELWARRNGLGA